MTQHTAQRILIVGGGSGIGRALSAALIARGDDVVIGARHPETVDVPGASTAPLDLSDEASIAAVAERGPVDHVVSLGAAPANGPLDSLAREDIARAFDVKVIGPLLLAKHIAPTMPDGGAFVFFSGVAAWAPARERTVMATTNGAVSFLVEALAVEIAPHRAVAISPGTIDSGSWDVLGADEKSEMFAGVAQSNPVRRVGQVDDVVAAVLFALDNGYLTGSTLHVDGGGRLV